MAERRQRDIDQARPQRRQLLGRQAAAAERSWPIALREHIGLAHQPTQDFEIARVAKIEMGRQLAPPRIGYQHSRQIGAGHEQDVGTVRGQCAAADRPGDHPCQIEHARAGKGALRGTERLRRCVADPLDRDERQ